MQGNKKYKGQIEINDLIDDAMKNALARRGLVEQEALLTLSDDEIVGVIGGLTTQKPVIADEIDITVAGFKPIKPPIKPICPPIVVGLIAVDNDKLA